MKIKLSKSQWEGIGKKAGWIKKASVNIDEERGYSECYDCGEKFETSFAVEIPEERDRSKVAPGSFIVPQIQYRCPECGSDKNSLNDL